MQGFDLELLKTPPALSSGYDMGAVGRPGPDLGLALHIEATLCLSCQLYCKHEVQLVLCFSCASQFSQGKNLCLQRPASAGLDA